jgi:iron complex transport system substrate-binding protein
MRIASLLPAATEWICAFGAADALVARSHECDFPEAVHDVPVVTEATYESGGDSKAIDDAVQRTLQDGLSLYDVDLDRLRALDPDLIVTQAQCEVCAVSRSQLDDALAAWTDGTPEVLSLQPQTFKAVLDGALRLGRAIGRTDAAMAVVAEKEKHLQQLRDTLGIERRGDPEARPTVACIEWMEPLMVAGHWMPDVVEHAGAQSLFTEAGDPSPTVAWDDLRTADPDVIAVLPCGFTIDETVRDLSYLTDRDGWPDLAAVRNDRVFVFDGTAYFNRPGPRLYRSVALLADALHPGRLALDPSPAPWERIGFEDAAAAAPEPSRS